jgi:cellulose synthase/poly-beta-1,6-N-acetylglucosamine synthase-like glycosyltransferase
MVAIPSGVFVAYLLMLLLAASLPLKIGRSRRTDLDVTPSSGGSAMLKTIVIVPAHNEEQVLAATLQSLVEQDYPKRLFEVVVVADNCTDTTAAIASGFKATVLERHNLDQRGKGYALDWAVSQLLARKSQAEAFVVIDADTWVAPDFLKMMTQQLAEGTDKRGCCALQGRYGVLNVDDGWRTALMSAALDLYNHIRPLGCARLGLSVSLKGNGMGFTREVLLMAKWQGRSITEDVDFGLDLIRNHGIRVGYVPAARVLAQMPITSAQAASQRERWEGGRYSLLRERALPLVTEALRRRNLALFDAAYNLIVPPLAELAVLILALGCLIGVGYNGQLLYAPTAWIVCYGFISTGFVAYILGGMSAAGAPRSAFAALLKAPFYITWKFGLYAIRLVRLPFRSTEPVWVRTDRNPVMAESGPEGGAQSARQIESA